MLGFSAKTIRRDIASMPDDVRKMSLACPSDVPVMSLTEYGLKWLAEKHGVPFSGSSPDGSSGRQEISIHALLAESDAVEIVIIVVHALFLSTLSLRRATAKVHKTVGHFCAYETTFMGIASSY